MVPPLSSSSQVDSISLGISAVAQLALVLRLVQLLRFLKFLYLVPHSCSTAARLPPPASC